MGICNLQRGYIPFLQRGYIPFLQRGYIPFLQRGFIYISRGQDADMANV
jgi:hypothetical protein